MQKRTQIEVAGCFVKFGWLNSSDIANDDSAKCFSRFVDVSRPCIINQLCIISIIYAKKSQKLGFRLFNQVRLSSGKAVCWGHCLIRIIIKSVELPFNCSDLEFQTFTIPNGTELVL